ncbi:MAG: hypothetical protein LBL59_04880 [Xanthomonadaceae bacterium]|jgi:hypothetical protein|nr:hypothetical protein [Xanthomonadaceae bacterium]
MRGLMMSWLGLGLSGLLVSAQAREPVPDRLSGTYRVVGLEAFWDGNGAPERLPEDHAQMLAALKACRVHVAAADEESWRYRMECDEAGGNDVVHDVGLERWQGMSAAEVFAEVALGPGDQCGVGFLVFCAAEPGKPVFDAGRNMQIGLVPSNGYFVVNPNSGIVELRRTGR